MQAGSVARSWPKPHLADIVNDMDFARSPLACSHAHIAMHVLKPGDRRPAQIPTAKNIPLGEVPKAVALSAKEFEAKYGFPKPAKNSVIVLYCRAGVRSEQVSRLFHSTDSGNESLSHA